MTDVNFPYFLRAVVPNMETLEKQTKSKFCSFSCFNNTLLVNKYIFRETNPYILVFVIYMIVI